MGRRILAGDLGDILSLRDASNLHGRDRYCRAAMNAQQPPDPDLRADEGRDTARARGSVLEVFLAFLQLGLTSFGGPVAHLGYFRAAFVERRGWLDDRSY